MLAYMMQWTVMGVVAFELAGTNTAVGLVQLGLGLSMLILGPFGGVFADRVSKKPLVIWGETIIGVSFFVTGVMILTGTLTLLWLTLLTAVMGVVYAFLGPALQAWVGEVVPRIILHNAVALNQLASSANRVLGPFLGGLMLSSVVIGSGGAYIFMAVLFVMVVLTVAKLPATIPKPDAERRTVSVELMQGIRYVVQNPAIRTLMLLYLTVVAVGFMWQIALPAFLERHLNRSPTDVGLIFTINAIASLVVIVPLTAIVGTRWAGPAMCFCIGVLGAGFYMLAVASTIEMTVVATLALGPGMAGFILLNNALTMANTDAGYFGRVMSLTMLAWGFQAAIALPFGMLADVFGEREMLWSIGGLLLVIAFVSGWASRALQIASLNVSSP